MNTINGERGFTLIELLTVIAIIGIVAALGMTSFYVYRSDAAYAVSERLVQDGVRSIEATLNNVDQTFSPISNYTQTVQGTITDPSAAKVLVGLMVPKKSKIEFSYDPTCDNAACVLASFEARHCMSHEHIRWIRYGDGVDVRLEHLAGGGCT
jgi:prepilin-type N-terminal cleavage/methylation domain-containing protein